MIPKRVSLENFLSFGPRTEIVFDDDEPLWIIGGPNGVGKSAVFDAITFCLFGAHRGGLRDVEPLVRHGENGFNVGIEFEFNGTDYKVVRGRSSNRPVQSVHRFTENDWQRIPDITSAADVTAWTEKTLGLGMAAFSASVLLKQGEADKLLLVGPTERMGILKKIIGAARYETLSRTVRDATKHAATLRDELAKRRMGMPDVTAEEVEAASTAKDVAAAARTAAEQTVSTAAARVQCAKQFQSIERERDELNDRLAAAVARAADAVTIHREHGRLIVLTSVMPTLEKLIPLRDGLPELEIQRDKAAEDYRTSTAQREETARQIDAEKSAASAHRDKASAFAADIHRFQAEIERLRKEIANAEALAKLDAELARFEPDLEAKETAAAVAHEEAVNSERLASSEVTEVKTLLKQRKEEQLEFANVGEGKCSRCGLPVGPEHLASERARLDGLIRDLNARVTSAESKACETTANMRSASEARKELAARIKQRDKLAAVRQGQAALGGSADVAGLTAKLRDQMQAVAARESAHTAEREKHTAAEAEVKRLSDILTALVADLDTTSKRATDLDRKASTDRATADALAGQLPREWAATSADEFDQLQVEHRTLAVSRVAERYAELQQDFAQRDVWSTRLAQLQKEWNALPPEARVPVNVIEEAHVRAVADRKQADLEYEKARDTHADIVKQAKQLADLIAALAEAERVARVHEKLDRLLGNAGLQRELVRRAEAEIVRHANETAGKLSDGELTVTLADESDGDKALDLLVRVGDDPTPIPVAYLSGSQRFRVAVAVALGIGRFATHGAKPLECVIIDEGFGSLDRDGLRAAAEELTRLRGSLKRIILVSHQDDFTDRFPMMIRLSKGEHGTVAEKIRR